VVRSANNGISAIIDAHGRVRASLDLNERGYLDSDLPVSAAKTLYSSTGDGLFYVLLLSLAGLVVGAYYSREHQASRA